MSVIKIVKKILNLIAHQKSAEGYGNFAEAKLYADRAAALKRKHGITQEILNETTQTKERNWEFIFDHNHKYFRRRRIIWQEEIAKSLSYFWSCQLGVHVGNNLKTVVGEKMQRRYVVQNYFHFHKEAEIAADKFVGLNQERLASASKNYVRKIRQSFLLGYSAGIYQRIYEYKNLANVITELESKIGQDIPQNADGETKTAASKNQLTAKTQPELPEANGCVALVKSRKIVIRDEQPERRSIPFQKAKKPGESKIKEIEPMVCQYGAAAAFETKLPENIKQEIEPLIKRVEELKEVLRQKEEEKRKAKWEETFLSRGHFYGWGRSTSTTTAYQPGFNWGNNEQS